MNCDVFKQSQVWRPSPSVWSPVETVCVSVERIKAPDGSRRASTGDWSGCDAADSLGADLWAHGVLCRGRVWSAFPQVPGLSFRVQWGRLMMRRVVVALVALAIVACCGAAFAAHGRDQVPGSPFRLRDLVAHLHSVRAVVCLPSQTYPFWAPILPFRAARYRCFQ